MFVLKGEIEKKEKKMEIVIVWIVGKRVKRVKS